MGIARIPFASVADGESVSAFPSVALGETAPVAPAVLSISGLHGDCSLSVLTNGNLTLQASVAAPFASAYASEGRVASKRYFEVLVNHPVTVIEMGAFFVLNVEVPPWDFLSWPTDGSHVKDYLTNFGNVMQNYTVLAHGGTGLVFGVGDYVRCAVSVVAVAGTNIASVWLGNEAAWFGDPAAGTGAAVVEADPVLEWRAGISAFVAAPADLNVDLLTINFGDTPFHHAIPAGFLPYND